MDDPAIPWELRYSDTHSPSEDQLWRPGIGSRTFPEVSPGTREKTQTHLSLEHCYLMLQRLNLPGMVIQAVRPPFTLPKEPVNVLTVLPYLPLERLEVLQDRC